MSIVLVDDRSFHISTEYSNLKMALQHFDYILAIGTIFAFLDAWNIGEGYFSSRFAGLLLTVFQVPTMSPTLGPHPSRLDPLITYKQCSLAQFSSLLEQ